MGPYLYFAFVLSLVVICESSFVDTLHQCNLGDDECHRKQIQGILHKRPEGIPELDIPAFDPHVVKNLKISILEFVELTFSGGIRGIKNCVVNKYEVNLEDAVCKVVVTCDIVVNGTYKLVSTNKNLNVSGNGEGQVKIEKLTLSLEIKYDTVKRGDDIFFIAKKDKLTYTFDFGKMTMKANKLYLGQTESSAIIMKLVNDNSKELAKTYAKNIFDVAIHFVYDFMNKFIGKVPASKYIAGDLTPYITN